MNVLHLSLKNIISRPWWSGLSLVLLILGVGMIALMGHLEKNVNKTIAQNTSGIDMVVGAKGSPLQLILSSVLHIDAPTGNIPLSTLETLRHDRLVEKAIPLSYGDNFQGNRIVGTDSGFMGFYRLELAQGHGFKEDFEVVIGESVAKATGLKIGDRFTGAHGLQGGGHSHDEHAYKVVGILKYSGSVADHLILTSQESVWHIHSHEEDSDQKDHHEEEQEITAILVKFRNPMGIIQLPRKINQLPNLQAAVPTIEMNRLMGLLGVGVDTLKMVSVAIMLIGSLSIFITLLATMQDRKFEMAFMRAYGASRKQLVALVLWESLVLTGIGTLIGLFFSRLGMWVLNGAFKESYHYGIDLLAFGKEDLRIFLVACAMGVVAGIIPALQAFRLNISKTLANA